MIDYNINKENIVLKEYGRNIQKMVQYLKSIEDRQERTRYAYTLVELMKQINPSAKETEDHYHKLWDHLFIIANFDLDVDSPFPAPTQSFVNKKPQKVEYNTNNLGYKHYGNNIVLLIQRASETEDPREKENAALYVGKLMKKFYTTWNREDTDDKVICEDLKRISNGKIDLDPERVKNEGLMELSPKDIFTNTSQGNTNSGKSNRKNKRVNEKKRSGDNRRKRS